MTTEKVLEITVPALLALILGWLISSYKKASHEDLEALRKDLEQGQQEFEKRVVNPLSDRTKSLESRAETFATRAELRESVLDLKGLIAGYRLEVKEGLNDLRADLRARPRLPRQTRYANEQHEDEDQ